MANIRGRKSGNSGDDLLARLKKLIYISPPAVQEPALSRRKHPLLRFNLPPSRRKKIENRASLPFEMPSNGCLDSSALEFGCAADDCIGASAVEIADNESDPAKYLRRGTGPGLAGFNSSPCACCCCRWRRQASREWLLPRLRILPEGASVLEISPTFYTECAAGAEITENSAEDQSVLGVLSCGYVVSGKARLKELGRKHA